jgi:hypothetical protein
VASSSRFLERTSPVSSDIDLILLIIALFWLLLS